MKIVKISTLEGNKVVAPMSPMLTTQAVLKHFEWQVTSLAIYRLDFEDDATLNFKDGNSSITSHDFIIAVVSNKAKIFFIDAYPTILVHLILRDDEEIITNPEYYQQSFIKFPDDEKLIQLIKDIPWEEV